VEHLLVREAEMADLLMFGITLLMFAATLGFMALCQRLEGK
jgi:hypothetical protein